MVRVTNYSKPFYQTVHLKMWRHYNKEQLGTALMVHMHLCILLMRFQWCHRSTTHWKASRCSKSICLGATAKWNNKASLEKLTSHPWFSLREPRPAPHTLISHCSYCTMCLQGHCGETGQEKTPKLIHQPVHHSIGIKVLHTRESWHIIFFWGIS